MVKKDKIKFEAQAFDSQIIERMENGHIPDLRHPHRNEWFFNNVWRDPKFVEMSFGENLEYLMQFIHPNSKILEVGCGPGHMSLELARNGHNVIGMDLSKKCIDIAKKVVSANTYTDNYGSLEYLNGDFLDIDLENNSFNSIIFFGALSHFPNIDRALEKVHKLLKPKGRILIWDTCVEQYKQEDASLLYFSKMLLSFCGNYYETKELPENDNQLNKQINEVLNELKYIDGEGKNLQSPNDNSQNYKSMMKALKERFNKQHFSWESSFYRNIIAGIRFDDPKKEHALARFIRQMEIFFINKGRLNPAFFYYVGEK